jgi:hypothetical protein
MTRLKFTKELLDEHIIKNNASLLSDYDILTGYTIILYKCKCGNDSSKKFKYIVSYGATCDECKKQLSKERRKNTFKERYGVDCNLELDSIKERIKKTNLEKYGHTCSLSNKEIRDKVKKTWLNNYGVDNPNKCIDIINKTKQTNIRKYGVDNPNKLESVIEKTKKTNLERYGVNCFLQKEEVIQKREDTCLKRYGFKKLFGNINFSEKRKETILNKYGVTQYMLTPEFMIKKENSMMKKYGFKHALQCPKIFEKQQKTAFSRKKFIMPSGDIRLVQGFEPYALSELIKIYTEEQIKTNRNDIPKINYLINESPHVYYPDIYIPHENKIIEVKSLWTYNKQKENVIRKGEACIELNYNYELWIYDKKGKRLQ